MKKVYSFSLALVLAASLLTPEFASAKDSSYDEVLKELETVKEDIQKETELSLSEKEKISKDSHDLVKDYMDQNPDMDVDDLRNLLTSVKEIDRMMYNVAVEKGNKNFGSKSTENNYPKKMSSRNISSAADSWSGYGDILVSLEAKTGIWRHGHAAILSTKEDYVIEALPKPGVVHQSATKYWSTVDDETQYYVKGAEDDDYRMAVAYAKSQVGDSYGLETTLSNSSVWYCSKLVYRSWKDAGFSIGSLDEYTGVVLPSSLMIDMDTVSYKDDPY